MEVPTDTPFTEEQARFYFRDVVLGIEYCKSHLRGAALFFGCLHGHLFYCLSPSALPQDHPQGHQAIQPAAGRRRPRQDRRFRRQQGVRGRGRPPVVHSGDAGLHGPWDDKRRGSGLQRKGEPEGQVWGGGKNQNRPKCEKWEHASVCWPGVRRVGDGSHAVLLCLWKGE